MADHLAPKPDPKRPYKAYATVLAAFLSSLVLTNATDLGPLWVGIITAVLAALATYVTPNPQA